jgi:DNA polymerase-4
VVHLNVVDFSAAIAAAKDRALADRAYVIAGASSGRAVVLGLSRRAREEGLVAGMSLAAAQRYSPQLLIVPPDPAASARANEEMERIAAIYSPLVQNDSGGHLYLDLAGTARLFGPHIDCAVRIRNEIVEAVGIEPTVAVARNKLVAKVATRSIRPSGIASIREGDEASFLAPQDALLLPGIGPSIARVLSVTGLREIGQLAALSDEEALSLFGRRGLSLRDAALGLDESPVAPGGLAERVVSRRLEFAEDMLEAPLIRGALISLVEDAGLELRKALLAARRIRLAVCYADGVWGKAEERSPSPLVLDAELIAAADRTFSRAAERRVRLRAVALELADLAPARREPDLFIPEGPTRLERLQTAVDASRRRFGPAAVTRASALSALRA